MGPTVFVFLQHSSLSSAGMTSTLTEAASWRVGPGLFLGRKSYINHPIGKLPLVAYLFHNHDGIARFSVGVYLEPDFIVGDDGFFEDAIAGNFLHFLFVCLRNLAFRFVGQLLLSLL